MPSGLSYTSLSIPGTTIKALMMINYAHHSSTTIEATTRCYQALKVRFRGVPGSYKYTFNGALRDEQLGDKAGLAVRFEANYREDESMATILLSMVVKDDPEELITVERVMKRSGTPQKLKEPEATEFPPISIHKFLENDRGLDTLVRCFSVCMKCGNFGCPTCLSLPSVPITGSDPISSVSESVSGSTANVADTHPAVIGTSAVSTIMAAGKTSTPPHSSLRSTITPTPPQIPTPHHPRILPMEFSLDKFVASQIFCVLCRGTDCELCCSGHINKPNCSKKKKKKKLRKQRPPNQGPDFLCVRCSNKGCGLCAGGLLPKHTRVCD